MIPLAVRLRFLLLGATAMAAGCASVVSGSTQDVSFHSNPEGATIIADGKTLGMTPLTFPMKKSTYHSVTFEKDGYKPLTLPMQSRLNGWFWGNILFGGLVGSTTDGLSGAANEYSPGHFVVSLEPLSAMRIEIDTLKSDGQKAREFIVMAYRNIISELPKGDGEYVRSLMGVLNVAADDQPQAVKKLRALSEAYPNIVDFADHAIAMFEKPRPAAALRVRAAGNWDELKFGAPHDQYEFLTGLSQEEARTNSRAMTSKQRAAFSEYVLESKGQRSSLSWEFKVTPGLSAKESQFIAWYLRENTDYKVN